MPLFEDVRKELEEVTFWGCLTDGSRGRELIYYRYCTADLVVYEKPLGLERAHNATQIKAAIIHALQYIGFDDDKLQVC